MKKRFVALLLGLLLLLSAFGCSRKQTVPTGSLVGTWKDSYGLTEYKSRRSASAPAAGPTRSTATRSPFATAFSSRT